MRQWRTRRTPDESLRVLLEELDALRLDIAADLIVAAAAAEAERLDIASEVVDADRDELAAFAHRAERRLAGIPVASRPRASRVGSVVAAASLTGILAVGAAAAAVRIGTHSGPEHRAAFANAQLAASYDDFRRAVTQDASAEQLAAAVRRLHSSLAPLIAAAAVDPSTKLQVLDILRRETLLLEENQPAGAARVLAAARALVAQITGHATVRTPGSGPSTISTPQVVVTTPDGSKKDTTTQTRPKPTPSTTPSPAPSPTSGPTNQQPAPSPAPSAPPWPFGAPGFDRSSI